MVDPYEKMYNPLIEQIKNCRKCGLCETRTQAVPGDGSLNAKVMFIGEAPGANEDRQGKPFVGRAGQLLTDIIEKGMRLRREEVYITNVVKCRPPNNRVPTLIELTSCRYFWRKEIDIIHPCVIITLGKTAFFTLADIPLEEKLGPYRLKKHTFAGIPVVPTWHPAYLLRNKEAKRETWEDVQYALTLLGINK